MGHWAVIGAAGFVARRHIEAIRHHGGQVVAAVDPSDVAGHLDALAPGCRYFRDIAQLAAWSTAQREKLDGIAICTPNDLHAGQAMIAAGLARNVVVEKPAALTVADLDSTKWATAALGAAVYPVLQMRLHPEAKRLVEFARAMREPLPPRLTISYHAPRGDWYSSSWKGDPRRSGGLAFNLAIHAIDLAAVAFGPMSGSPLFAEVQHDGTLWSEFRLRDARVDLFVSSCPIKARRREMEVASSMRRETFDLSDGIDLHREWYGELLAGRAPTLEDARAGIEIAEAIRRSL